MQLHHVSRSVRLSENEFDEIRPLVYINGRRAPEVLSVECEGWGRPLEIFFADRPSMEIFVELAQEHLSKLK